MHVVAPFLGPRDGPIFGVASLSPGLTQLGLVSVPAPALVPGTLGSSVQNISLGIRGLSEAAACFCNAAAERELQLYYQYRTENQSSTLVFFFFFFFFSSGASLLHQ